MSTKTKTNLLIIPFNRPHYLKKILENIRLTDFHHIYCFIDGARNNDDQEKINEVKEIIKKFGITHINAQKSNLGINVAFETAISWFFSQVESGLILEEDCIPDPSLPEFVALMLERYRQNPEVGMIAAYNPHPTNKNEYFFSRQFGIWGWASWRDRWEDYTRISKASDITLSFKDLLRYSGSVAGAVTLYTKFQRQLYKPQAFWDINWVFTNAKLNRVCIIPARNLMKNIGHFGNSSRQKTRFHDNETNSLNIKSLTHPNKISTNWNFDRYVDFRFNFLPAIKTLLYQLLIRSRLS